MMRIHGIKSRVMAASFVACIMLGMAGCGKKAKDFDGAAIESILVKNGSVKIQTYDEFMKFQEEDIPEDILDAGYSKYVSFSGSDAQKLFNDRNQIYHEKTYYKVSDVLLMEAGKTATETSMDYVNIIWLDFESEEMAEEFYKNEIVDVGSGYVVHDVDISGEKDGYNYLITRAKAQTAGGGSYQMKDKIIRISYNLKSLSDKTIEEICREFGIKDPLKA